MAKFKATVTVRAEYQYTVEVEAENESKAENEAFAQWRKQMPDGFQVSKDYVTEVDVEETERLTYVCEDCGREYPAEPQLVPILNGAAGPLPLTAWCEDSDYCSECGANIEAFETAQGFAHNGRIHSKEYYTGRPCYRCGERPVPQEAGR